MLDVLLGLLPKELHSLTTEQYVKTHYPDALVRPTDQIVPQSHGFGVFTHQEAWALGSGKTEEEAWKDAATCLMLHLRP
jgi:hypothetical protein